MKKHLGSFLNVTSKIWHSTPFDYIGRVLIVCLVAGSLFFEVSMVGGCATGGKVAPEVGSSIVRLTVSTGAALVLNKNPKYIPAVQALAAGIDAAISSSTTLTIEGINAYVLQVCQKNGVSNVDAAIFTSLADTIYTAYVQQYKVAVVNSADPTVLLYVNAFKDGLKDATLVVSSPTLK